MLKAFCKSHLKRRVHDPELRKKLTPDYECGCKRLVFGKGFYQALQKPNVSFVTEGITRIEPDGIVAATGEEFPVDVIVYATGFHGHQLHASDESGWSRWKISRTRLGLAARLRIDQHQCQDSRTFF